MCEKILAKGKDVYFAFIDLVKAYNRADRRRDLWRVVSRLYIGLMGGAVDGIAELV